MDKLNTPEIIKEFNRYFEERGFFNVEFVKHNKPTDSSDFEYIIFKQNNKEIKIIQSYYNVDEMTDIIKCNFQYLFEKTAIKNLIKKYCAKYNKTKIEKEILTTSCCICFDNYSQNKVVLTCGHSVCRSCSDKIKICPYCRADTSTIIFNKIRNTIKKYQGDEQQLNIELNNIFNFDTFNKIYLRMSNLEVLGVDKIVWEQWNGKIDTDYGYLFFQIISQDEFTTD